MLDQKKVYYKHVFYISMSVLALIFVIVLFMTGGYSAQGLLFGTRNQSFMDFFNSMLYNINEPYENYVFYPPLSTLMYKFFLLLVPQSIIDKLVYNRYATSFTSDVNIYQQFLIPLILYTIITVVALYFALKNGKQGRTAEKLLFTFLIFTSAPAIFMFERANNIIIVLICTLIFTALHDSERRVLRELSLVALAIAVATKMYPIVFCAMLLKDKRFKDIFKVIFYSVLLFVVPFFIFYDGLESMKLLFTNLSSYDRGTNLGTGVQLNFEKMLILPLSQFNVSNELLINVGEVFRTVVMFCAIPSALFMKNKWKCAAICCCIIYGYQSTCATYLLVLFCIPVMLMLDSEKTHSVKNYIYLVLMILTLGLIVSLNPVTGEFTRFVGTKISSYAVMVMTAMLCFDGLRDMFFVLLKLTDTKRRVWGTAGGVSLLAVLLGAIFIDAGESMSMHAKNIIVCGVVAIIFAVFAAMLCLCGTKKEENKAALKAYVSNGINNIKRTKIFTKDKSIGKDRDTE